MCRTQTINRMKDYRKDKKIIKRELDKMHNVFA